MCNSFLSKGEHIVNVVVKINAISLLAIIKIFLKMINYLVSNIDN